MKVIIAGSRTIHNGEVLRRAIYQASMFNNFSITEIVSGCAQGVDTLGEEWAKIQNLPVKRFPADWKKHGKAAGPIRNAEMGKYADAAIVVWDGSSSGSRNMINNMKDQDKPCYVVKYREFAFHDFVAGIDELVRKIRERGHHFDYIVGIARGGLIPATWLSYKLGIPLVPITWSMIGTLESNHWLAEDIFKGKRVLVVDDIIDNGDTIRSLIADWQSGCTEQVLMLANIEIATLVFNKQQQEVEVDYCVDSWIINREKDSDWVSFFWDH